MALIASDIDGGNGYRDTTFLLSDLLDIAALILLP
jgi:hypothetical protein